MFEPRSPEGQMHVTVLYFAGLRERRGAGREVLPIVEGDTVGALYARIFGPDAPTVAYTRNRSVCAASTALTDGDEVSFLPPLGGG